MPASHHPRRLIWFCQTESVAAQPEVLTRLRDEIGLTTIMPESPVCHTSGFAASRELAQAGPFEDWRSRAEAWPGAREGIYPPVAGIISGFDDAPLLRLIEACASAGIEVWGHLGLWSYGGEVYPEHALCDLDGQPLDRHYQRWGIGLCPSRPAVNDWTRDCLVHVVRHYGVDGICVDHARYPAPANPHALLACGCPHCQEAALELGFAFESLRQGVGQWLERVRGLTPDGLHALARARPGLFDLLTWLGDDEVLLEWLEFRARLLARRMEEFHQAVRGASGQVRVFGSDVFPPSVALLGGHLYEEWERGADFLTGGASFGGVVGWATCVPSLAAEWARALLCAVPEAAEADALALVWRLFGYDDLPVPRTLAELQAGPLPLEEIYAREVDRLRAGASGAIPLYPPVTATGSPEQVRRLCQAVVDNRCDGAMLNLDLARTESLAVVGQLLGG
ncbi:MAG: hypothetical protein AB1505_17410 [Candidatus Latescibacterota bacterium]